MISIVIATRDSERALLAALPALVPGAMDGLVREVIVADGGSRDATARVADAAGCEFVVVDGPVGHRLRKAAATARAPWLLFLRPGIALDPTWVGAARRFVEHSSPQAGAAVFRRGAPAGSTTREALSLLAAAWRLPKPEQGLLLGREFYDALGGHAAQSVSPEADLVRRIGRRRLAVLGAHASAVPILD